MSGKKNNRSALPNSANAKSAECLEKLKLTRDLEVYLDLLDAVKSEYLMILCLNDTSDHNISGKTAEKIRSLGFLNYTAKPDTKYVGISVNGRIVCDHASGADRPPLRFETDISGTNLSVSFEKNEVEININGVDRALNGKGLNIAVYDLKKSDTEDVSCYDASGDKPEFYHCNRHYDRQYIDSHIYTPESCKKLVALPLRRSYFSNRKLNVREVKGGIFLPRRFLHGKTYGGVCDENFDFVAGHQLHNVRNTRHDDRHIAGSYEAADKDIAYVDETVLYGGTMIEHPGHMIAESFADRMWWLAQNADSDIKIAVEIIWGKTVFSAEYSSFVMEFFDAFGVSRDRIIVIEKPTRFKSIIVPDQSAIPLNYCFPYEFTSEYIKPFQHITKRLTPGKYKKIYLTKINTQQKNIAGEEFYIDFFEKKGFKIIHPEEYTIKEKAELMYGADEVVTVDGTNSLFTVFCKPTVRLTILVRRLDFWDTPQQLINEAVGIKEFFLVNAAGGFLDGFSDDPFPIYAGGMTFLSVTEEFKKYVKYVYNEELDIDPREALKNGLYDYLSLFTAHYSDPTNFRIVKDIKMIDVLRGISEIVFGRSLDAGRFEITTAEKRIKKLMQRQSEDNEANAEKIKLITDKENGYIGEIAALKRSIARLEAENEQLRKEKSEMVAYVDEINSLLDSLEREGDPPAEE